MTTFTSAAAGLPEYDTEEVYCEMAADDGTAMILFQIKGAEVKLVYTDSDAILKLVDNIKPLMMELAAAHSEEKFEDIEPYEKIEFTQPKLDAPAS